MTLIERSPPVMSDPGLIEAAPDRVSSAYADWQTESAEPMAPARRLGGSTLRNVALLFCLLQAACCLPRAYEGEGSFTDSCRTDSWYLWGLERFDLDLGALDLTTPGVYVYELGALPRAETWLLGLRVEPLPDRPREALLDESAIAVEMTNRAGHLVLSVSEPIDRWAWMTTGGGGEGIGPAFVYLAGEIREVPIGKGNSRLEPVGVRAEGGWGTCFDPERGSGYRLVVRVVAPDPDAEHFRVSLHARGSNHSGSL